MQFKLNKKMVVSDAFILPFRWIKVCGVEKSRYTKIELLFHLKIH